MDIDSLKELIEKQFEIIDLKIAHTNKRIDGLITNLRWVIGIVVPVLTVILQTVIERIIK